MKKRHNIDTIAEVLIDKLNDMERTAKRIETVAKNPLKVDSSYFEELIKRQNNAQKSSIEELKLLNEEQRDAEKAFLTEIKSIRKENQSRMPNWVLACLIGVYLLSMGMMFYAWKKAEGYKEAEKRALYFEQELNKLNAK